MKGRRSAPAKTAEEELAEVRAEVDEVFKHHSEDWRKLQQRVFDRACEYQRSGPLRSAIYHVYTREERQPPNTPHRHLKNAAKVAEEIFLNRRGGTKTRMGQERKIAAQPKFTIYDVSDIIGVTIVCPFEADVEKVVKEIEGDSKRFATVDKVKRHDRQDYQAVHIAIRIPGDRLRELQCEIQVKTAVQDAFSWKTHSLSYKPGEHADPWFAKQFTRISLLLRTADGFSDQLRERLEEERNVSLAKRTSVRADLLLVLRDLIATIPDKKKRQQLRNITVKLRDYMKPDARDRTDLERIEDQVRDALKKYGHDANTLRLAVLCAIAPGSDGYIYTVRRNFDEWTAAVSGGKRTSKQELIEWTDSANFIAIAYYCLNDISGAIYAAEQAVRRASRLKSPVIGSLHVNLAYYCAESYSETMDKDQARRAQEHARAARKIFGKALTSADRDSLGYVQIASATSIAEIEAGLAECKTAFQDISENGSEPEKQLAAKFFEIHQELAYKRLSQIASGRR